MRMAESGYALKQFRILYEPDRRIDSFGDTRFNFRMVSELMDQVGVCRIRSGRVEATRPRIVRPADMCSIEMEGFSSETRRIFERLQEQGVVSSAVFRYGFQFCRSEVQEELIHEDVRSVSDKLTAEALSSGDPLRAVISAADDAWEISLLYFMVEIIRQSYETNAFDFKRRGLL